ncbi:MAG: helix-turn-helix transcriptional regulator [Acidobacteriota bacterium]
MDTTPLRQRRLDINLQLAEMAERVGISESKLSAIERGHRDDLKLEDALAIAAFFEITVEELYHLWKSAE